MIAALLMACQVTDLMQERAENAALVCYDNGTLVYASETTQVEVGELIRAYSQCTSEHVTAGQEMIRSKCGGDYYFTYPSPFTYNGDTQFMDKGVMFKTSMNCFSRVTEAQATTNKEKK